MSPQVQHVVLANLTHRTVDPVDVSGRRTVSVLVVAGVIGIHPNDGGGSCGIGYRPNAVSIGCGHDRDRVESRSGAFQTLVHHFGNGHALCPLPWRSNKSMNT